MPASGGSNRSVLAPTTYQGEQLYQQLVERLHQQALEDLSRQIEPGDLLLTPTLTITQVIREEYNPPPGQPSDQLNLGLTLGFQVQVASDADLKALAKGVLDANIPHGYHSKPGTVAVELFNEPEIGLDGYVSWKMRTTQHIEANLEETRAGSLVRGLALGAANEKLREFLPIESAPRIQIFPSWWPRLPLLPFRISVISK
jgi:hypothetical protein